MEIEQKDKSTPVHSAEFVEQKDRYITKLEAEVKALREALTEIERVCDNNNPTHADIWRRAYQELNKK